MTTYTITQSTRNKRETLITGLTETDAKLKLHRLANNLASIGMRIVDQHATYAILVDFDCALVGLWAHEVEEADHA